MQCINKARLLTDIEKKFLKALKKDRSKRNFKNPSVIHSQLKDKSKEILLSIPELVEDIDLLYKFASRKKILNFMIFAHIVTLRERGYSILCSVHLTIFQ